MKASVVFLFLAVTLAGQTPPPVSSPSTSAAPPSAAPASATLNQKDTEQMALRMVQLMESTAVAVPGLIRASEPVKQNAEMTMVALQRAPQSPAITYQFINQVKAYLALADSIPRPFPFPQTADAQFSELREDLARMQQHFEAVLQVQNLAAQAKDRDPAGRKKYEEANNKALPAGAIPRVIFFGDSITENWRLNEYFTGRDFMNRGITGQTTTQMLGRILQDVFTMHPKAVVYQGGVNDLADGITVAAIEDNFSIMGDLARARGVKPLFASLLPVSSYHKDQNPRFDYAKTVPLAAIVQLNRWLQDYCEREHFIYVDYYSALVDGAGQFNADLSDDGLHPNGKGYRLMSPIALEAVGRAINTAGDTLDKAQPKKRGRD